jgi:serine/threonine-protein kinase
MGAVYSAHDPAIGRPVAIKLVSEGFRDSRARERLANEARAVGRLRHPHIVTVFDVGEHDGQLFIVMERVLGEPLSSMLSRRPRLLDLATGLTLIEEACSALAYAHQMGTVHLDIKPDNLMVDETGHVKILDFGIARVGGDDVTRTSSIVGSLRYMAPEQLTGGVTLDRRSDVFAIGCVLYELVAGVPAFEGRISDVVARVLGDDPPPLAEAVPGTNPDLSALVARMMARDPKGRPDDLVVVGRDLALIHAQLTGQLTPVAASQPSVVAGSTASRAVSREALAGVAGLFVVVGLAGVWLFMRTEAPPAASAVSATAQAPPAQASAPAEVPASAPPDTAPPVGSGAVASRSDDPPTPPTPTLAVSPRETRRGPDGRPNGRSDPTGLPRETARENPSSPASPPPPTAAPEPQAGVQSSDPRPVTEVARDTAAASTPAPPPPNIVRGAPGRLPSMPAPVSEEARVLAALDRYKQAFQERRVEALEEVYPALTPEQRARLRRDLAVVDRYQIEFSNTQVAVRGDAATVTTVVTREMQPRVGRPQRNATPTTFYFHKAGDAWVIDTIAAR